MRATTLSASCSPVPQASIWAYDRPAISLMSAPAAKIRSPAVEDDRTHVLACAGRQRHLVQLLAQPGVDGVHLRPVEPDRPDPVAHRQADHPRRGLRHRLLRHGLLLLDGRSSGRPTLRTMSSAPRTSSTAAPVPTSTPEVVRVTGLTQGRRAGARAPSPAARWRELRVDGRQGPAAGGGSARRRPAAVPARLGAVPGDLRTRRHAADPHRGPGPRPVPARFRGQRRARAAGDRPAGLRAPGGQAARRARGLGPGVRRRSLLRRGRRAPARDRPT